MAAMASARMHSHAPVLLMSPAGSCDATGGWRPCGQARGESVSKRLAYVQIPLSTTDAALWARWSCRQRALSSTDGTAPHLDASRIGARSGSVARETARLSTAALRVCVGLYGNRRVCSPMVSAQLQPSAAAAGMMVVPWSDPGNGMLPRPSFTVVGEQAWSWSQSNRA